MTLRHMRIFVSVYQTGSMTKAAQVLHLAQPSVSLAVKDLEAYYGVRLFDRLARRLYPTGDGQRFYDYALHIVSLFDEMEKGIRNWDSLGTLRVGSSVTIGTYFMPEWVLQFTKQYPMVKIQVSIRNSAEMEQMVLNNQVDFAFIEGKVIRPQLKQLSFLEDRLCIAAASNHPLAEKAQIPLDDLMKENFLLREKGSAGRELLEHGLELYGFRIDPIWESVSNQALIHGAMQGIGLTVLPYLLVRQELEKGALRELNVPQLSLSRHFSVVFHENKFFSPAAKAFLSQCASGVQLPFSG